MSRYLGQHFLKNQKAIEKIVMALDLKEGGAVVEIGSGHGELTKELLKHPINIVSVEKDKVLAEKLKINNERLKVVEGDILKILPQLNSELKTNNYKLVGNIPYYITGFLFRTISELENKPELIVFTIQKEVAERICAIPPKMNLLAASVQIWAKPKILMTLPPTDFDPPPKVTSAIIRLETNNLESKNRNLENYYKFIKVVFKQPRKNILNNLSDGLSLSKENLRKKLQKLNFSGEERGQNLDIDQLVKLSEVIHL